MWVRKVAHPSAPNVWMSRLNLDSPLSTWPGPASQIGSKSLNFGGLVVTGIFNQTKKFTLTNSCWLAIRLTEIIIISLNIFHLNYLPVDDWREIYKEEGRKSNIAVISSTLVGGSAKLRITILWEGIIIILVRNWWNKLSLCGSWRVLVFLTLKNSYKSARNRKGRRRQISYIHSFN